ncbi:hypothetical protein ST47_g10217 [Ascochyta rabiei]|uniref:Uncharacterized protein n=1 Tax=Didymella rabiei TaxID=5454 RepID=A0A162VUE2_DIDRA|nr:hypothetical protein ST47_g10217 [Ascochyta rabiei]
MTSTEDTPASHKFQPDTTAMEAFAPPSASPSHYSPEAIGFLFGAGALVLILIILWVYIAAEGGPSETLRSFRGRREAKRKALDIEMAERTADIDRVLAQGEVDKELEEEQKIARQEALNLLNGLMANNNLVGSTLPARPKAVDFREEQGEEKRLMRLQKSWNPVI